MITEFTAIGLYLAYAALAVGLVVFLARTLYRNGEVFLRDVFEEADMARSVNHLLVVGFYLLNLGYALLLYEVPADGATLTFAFNGLVSKLGALLLSLGVIHLVNMFVFWKIRTHRDRRVADFQPPPPTLLMQPQPPTPPVGV
ncbi:MAG: hypothetical protein ACI8TP_002694 [Acidimicrobiales bacterium]|jgi:hypothetical protein